MVNKQNILKVLFPHEHGAWGFFLEPIVLALIIAFTTNGLLLAFSSFLLFLASQSLSILLKRKPEYLVLLASITFAGYFITAILLFYFVSNNSSDNSFLFPFVLAMSIMGFYKLLEVKNQNRLLIVELLAPISVILISISIVMLNEWDIKFLISFAIVLLSRSIQTVFYVNNKLKFFKDNNPNKLIVHIIGFVFFLLLLFQAIYDLIPYLSLLAILLLIVRAYLGFMKKNKTEKVKIVGIKEFIYGFLFVVIISIGYLYKL